MPDFSSVFNSSASPSSHCSKSSSSFYPNSVASKPQREHNGRYCSWDRKGRYQKAGVGFKVLRRDQKRLVRRGAFDRSNKLAVGKSLEDHVRAWLDKKLESGVPERECFLPFLLGAPKSADCRMCGKVICSGEEVVCSVRSCQEAYHLVCAKGSLEFSTLRSFKCPQHACFVCKQKGFWRCTRCTVASHSKCAPWQDKVIYLTNQPGRAVCWRHPTNWRLEKKHAVPTSDIEEIFCHLPLPYVEEDFKFDFIWKDMTESKIQPAPYVHIRRNVYLVKKKRDDLDAGIGCTNCSATICSEACVCRVQSISCSKSCHCSDMCTNRPFRKEKKVKVVKTQYCGWGVEAAESIKKGEFIIEYIGEVIDDALCEQRLWDIKYRGDQNFYMCEIRKDFTIDATFKGNAARFLNHSCDPNCKLEKWQVDGKTCVGIFAARPIKAGESLTYDYRFVHFGPKVKCFCGSSNCQGYLGFKRKTDNMDICWGCKRRRSSMSCVKV